MYLSKIIDYKKQELEHQKRRVSLKDVRAQAEDAAPARDFLRALNGSDIRIISEIKKASPSAGIICPNFDPVRIAADYEENGAVAISVLTDEHFFQGRLSYLREIKKAVKLPLLRKDFTLDAYHIYEARGAEADAVLLIAAVLEDAQLKDYSALANDLGMAALLEVHNEAEMKRASKLGAALVGINNRDLKTFQVDLKTSERLSKLAPSGTVLVSESGISTASDIQQLLESRISCFLIGESLLKHSSPGAKLKELIDKK